MQIVNAIFGAAKTVVKALNSTKKQRSPEWMESFILWYAVDRTKMLSRDETFSFIERLQTGSMNSGDKQSFLVHLKVYLYWLEKEGLNPSSSKGPLDPSSFSQVLRLIPNTLSTCLTGYLSEGAFRGFHSKNIDPATMDEDRFITEVKQMDKSSEEWKGFVHELMTIRLTNAFERRHSEKLSAFTSRVYEEYHEEKHDEGAAPAVPFGKGAVGSAQVDPAPNLKEEPYD